MKAPTIKALLIDPVAKQVAEVVVENNLQAFYHLLQCSVIEAAYPRGLAGTDHLYVDEEGLFKPRQRFFHIRGYPQPLAGRALMLGIDAQGESIDVASTFEQVRALIGYPP